LSPTRSRNPGKNSFSTWRRPPFPDGDGAASGSFWPVVFMKILGGSRQSSGSPAVGKSIVAFVDAQRARLRQIVKDAELRTRLWSVMRRATYEESERVEIKIGDGSTQYGYTPTDVWDSAWNEAAKFVGGLVGLRTLSTKANIKELECDLADFITEAVLITDFNHHDMGAQIVRAVASAFDVPCPTRYNCYELECWVRGRSPRGRDAAKPDIQRWYRGFAHKLRRDLVPTGLGRGSRTGQLELIGDLWLPSRRRQTKQSRPGRGSNRPRRIRPGRRSKTRRSS
jgi:hypothetical protein